MRKIVFILLGLVAFGCQKAEETKIETNSVSPTKTVQTPKTEVETPKATLPIDITKLVNKSVDGLDNLFGKPVETKPNDDGGDYRLYNIANEPKGLAVRFYEGKAKSFNLILTNPVATSKDALKQVFGIDIGNMSPIKDPKEPLTEKYQGNFGGVNYRKVSAKKDGKGNGFIFVLAEVEK